jgi:7-carboxy-7-deazaguanine synthase
VEVLVGLHTEMINMTLPVMEDFYTIQGEGYFQGHAAYFVRLAGCDVGCVWCDVKESWDASAHPLMRIGEITERIQRTNAGIVVVTGGEPAMYDLSALTTQLKRAGYRTHIETSGAYPLTGTWDWVCFSPKKFKSPHSSVFSQSNELKIVVYNMSDFEWAEAFAEKVPEECILYLQPEWSREQEMVPQIIAYVKENPRWKISLQIHKYMNIP